MKNINIAYKPAEFEEKWANEWLKTGIYKATDSGDKKKSYLLVEFPYPSGERLHVGHARSYSCLDAVARMRRMKGKNVMFPMGWDAFGLPAENYAVKTGIHPSITTRQNIENSKKQAIRWGLSFDWDREIDTTDSNYYKWTQWIFEQLFKKGLAYKSEIAVNWCPSCKTNLANEEVIDNKCERCGAETERRKQSQWLLKITEYADRLLEDLKTVDYREDIVAQQVNWIGRKEGAKVRFQVSGFREKTLEVFTTRLDTLFGVTFIVLAPEHTLVQEILNTNIEIPNKSKIQKYVIEALNKSERSRKQDSEKTGMDLGVKAINPANGKEIPIWVADYVMMDVGTGAVMGVPAHDQRDWEFAKQFGLSINEVVSGGSVNEAAYTGNGTLVNSGKYTDLDINKATDNMIKDGLGEKTTHYHLRDWVFSRQHYWGEPIPMINCPKDGWVPVPEDQLPVTLPPLEKFQPTGTGESPLAHIKEFVEVKCPKCGGQARRETDTMPNWAGSSWYYLRYCDPHNKKALADKKKLEYWLPVDWYNGGMEHTTLHLLYSRFWHKFLYDLGVVPTSEPYARRTSHGVVLGPDGRRMSKSKGNVINPDEVVAKYGADTLRMYEMFIGPFDQTVTWSWEGVEGVHRFLKRIWDLCQISNLKSQDTNEAKTRIAKLIYKVEVDIEAMKFNTAVAAMMEFSNWWMDNPKALGLEGKLVFLKLLAPMAPFVAEELYQRLSTETDKSKSIHIQSWPRFDPRDLEEENVTVVVQVNGKVRGKMVLSRNTPQKETETVALEMENVKKHIQGKYRTVFVPGKIINFIIE